jgi:TRAP-type C4-dicarboxylate transport system substrate-binding protein
MIRRTAASVALSLMLMTGCDAGRPSTDGGPATIHVIGSSANSNLHVALEAPFWTETLPAASGGRIRTDFRSVTESGLKGPEIGRLLSAGALHVAYSDFNTIAGDVREFEGLELAGVITDYDVLHRASDAYKPVLERIFNQHGVHLLGLVPYPQFAFYCRGRVSSLNDLAGKKVRVTVQSMSDFVRAIGGIPVTLAFPDVAPGLQTGVIDCAITGTYTGNRAGWHEMTDSLYTLPVGGGVAFYGYSARGWRELDPEMRALVEAEFAKFEDQAWELTRAQTQTGINCNTGRGECIGGTVSNMTLFEPSQADVQRARAVAMSVVMPNWSKRCGARCIADWNATVGPVTGIHIPTPTQGRGR